MPPSSPGRPPPVAVSPVLLRGFAAMTACTQRLPVGRIPEQLLVSFMRPDMVKVCRRRSANGAERMLRHEHFPRSTIDFVGVQGAIGNRVSLQRFFVPLAIRADRQGSTARRSAWPHRFVCHVHLARHVHIKRDRPPAISLYCIVARFLVVFQWGNFQCFQRSPMQIP